MDQKNSSSIAVLRTPRRPYKELRSEHLEFCARDVAAIFAMAVRPRIGPETRGRPFYDVFARQLAHIRRLNARILPATREPEDDPLSLAEIADEGEFLARCAAFAEKSMQTGTNTPEGREIVRRTILENSSDSIIQALAFVRRHHKTEFAQQFTRAANARGLFREDSGFIALPDGIVLHQKINLALNALGLAPYPDTVPPEVVPPHPGRTPELKIVR